MDLVALCRYIWLRRYFVCKVAVAGVILGVIIALSIPKEYSTKVQLLPYASKNDRADKNASFASMLGLTVNNSIRSTTLINISRTLPITAFPP